ncbi:MAG: O-succinylhomoserine sulfhydrylase [Pseudomonadota bacterium]
MSDDAPFRPQTAAVRAGLNRAFQETSEGLFLTSGYAYESAEEAAARFAGEDPGYIYARFSNPTVEAFEARLAALEGARFCRATASGMAAVTATMLTLLSAGDHVVSARALFGSCRYVVEELCPRLGIASTLVDGTDLDAWRAAARPETKVFFLESPANPTLEIVDIAAIAEIAREAGARLVVDNVFATPILQKPFDLGANVVVYSATKHIDGQGRVLGGAILMNDEDYLKDQLQPFLRNTGPAMSAFNAWVLVKGLETLSLRVRAAQETAARLADLLAASPAVTHVFYPGREDHPQYEIGRRQMAGGGTLVAFEVAGGQEAAFRFLNALQVIDISNNLGDAKSLATHPRTTTHHRLGEDARAELGVTPGLLRLSVGLEDASDLHADLERALNAV